MGLIEASVEFPSLVPAGSLIDQVAPRLYADSPWSSWNPLPDWGPATPPSWNPFPGNPFPDWGPATPPGWPDLTSLPDLVVPPDPRTLSVADVPWVVWKMAVWKGRDAGPEVEEWVKNTVASVLLNAVRAGGPEREKLTVDNTVRAGDPRRERLTVDTIARDQT